MVWVGGAEIGDLPVEVGLLVSRGYSGVDDSCALRRLRLRGVEAGADVVEAVEASSGGAKVVGGDESITLPV